MGELKVIKLSKKKDKANYIHQLIKDIDALDIMIQDGLIEKSPIRIEAEQEFCLMQVEETRLDGVLLVTPDIHVDARGTYVETYNMVEYIRAGIPYLFVQDDMSASLYNVLRGIHGDEATWKLVSCPVGMVYLVVVNWDADSSQYKQWQAFNLTQQNYRQILIPPKFGNGHLVLSKSAVFHYKQTTYYGQYPQFSIPYNEL